MLHARPHKVNQVPLMTTHRNTEKASHLKAQPVIIIIVPICVELVRAREGEEHFADGIIINSMNGGGKHVGRHDLQYWKEL